MQQISPKITLREKGNYNLIKPKQFYEFVLKIRHNNINTKTIDIIMSTSRLYI